MAEGTAQKRKGIFPGWYMVFAGAFHGLWGMGFWYYCWGVFVPFLMRGYGITAGQLGIASTMGRISGGLEGPIAGWVVEKYGPRFLSNIGFIASSIGFIMIGLIPNQEWAFPIVVVGYGIFTLLGANVSLYQSSFVAVTKWFIKNRGKALGLIVVGAGIGNTILVPLTQAAVNAYGWQATIIGIGILTAVTCIPIGSLAFKPKGPEHYGWRPDNMSEEEYQETQRTAALGMTEVRTSDISFTWRQALKMWQFWTICGSVGVYQLGVQSMNLFQNIAMQEAGYTSMEAAFYFSGVAIVTIVGRTWVSIVGDRINPRWSVVLYWSMTAVGYILFTNVNRGPVFVWSWLLIYGFGYGAMIATASIVQAWYFGRANFGQVMGWGGVVMFISSFWGPWVTGALRDWTGNYNATFYFASFGFVLAAVLVAITPRPKPKVTTETPAAVAG